MSVSRTIARLFRDESGSFTSTAIFLGIVVAIMAVAVIDGSAVFFAYRSSNQVTLEASELAMEEYKLNRNEYVAQQTAIDHCEDRGLEFIEVKRLPELSSNAFEVTCEKDADTFVFKRLPWFRELIHQRTANTEYRSI